MANKVVQLVDANDDNIFPLSSDPNAARITMTPTDPGEGVPLGQNEFIAVYGSDPIIMDYSTSEINTGAKWIDGSTIYKKTINFGSLPNNNTKSIAHGITNLKTYVKPIEAMMLDSAGTSCWSIPYTYVLLVSADATNVNIRTNSDLTAYNAYATVYYTKTS